VHSLLHRYKAPILAAATAAALVACSGDDGKEKPDDSPRDTPADSQAEPAETGRATEPLPKGEPIQAEPNSWTWVDFPETRCMDDSATGLGIRLNPDSDKLLIVIQGGGACFNATTCLAVANPRGFTGKDLASQTELGLLNSSDPDNPFRDWNKVFIPYCSGDIFSGAALDKTGYQGRTQAGYLNMRHYLTRLVPTFREASRVVLSGYSAGGFAATVNVVQAIEGWGDVRIDVLNDSGPPLGEEYLTPCLQKRLAETWKWGANIPKSCRDCDVSTGHVTEPVLRWSNQFTKHSRMGLISSNEDSVIKLFYAYGLNDCANLDSLIAAFPSGLYEEGLRDLQERVLADNPNFRSFIIESGSHVWTMQSPGAVSSNDVVLRDWIEAFLDPDAEWESVTTW
jgi:hypothetical protein